MSKEHKKNYLNLVYGESDRLIKNLTEVQAEFMRDDDDLESPVKRQRIDD